MSETDDVTLALSNAVDRLRRGEMIVVTDDASRENEGDLVMAADAVTDQHLAFMVRHGTGIVCAPMSDERADELELPLMVADNTDSHRTAFTVSVDHCSTSTGVSAADRAVTLRALANPATTPSELNRPGHVFPLRARPGGVLDRPGHTEATVDLLHLAGLAEVGVITELTSDDGTMLAASSVTAFAAEHGLPVVSVADLIAYRRRLEPAVERVAEAAMPTEFGVVRAVAFRSTADGTEHLALVMGDPSSIARGDQGALVRVHSECLTGDALGSLRCDCGAQLRDAMETIAGEGCGVIVYLRGHEGRGIGLARKIRAYQLQDGGLDTVDANTAQGLPIDSRSYEAGAHILRDLGVMTVQLITNNPKKDRALSRYGITVDTTVRRPTAATEFNLAYLRAKQERMGHSLGVPPIRKGQARPHNLAPLTALG